MHDMFENAQLNIPHVFSLAENTCLHFYDCFFLWHMYMWNMNIHELMKYEYSWS